MTEPVFSKREATAKCICGKCDWAAKAGDVLWALPLNHIVQLPPGINDKGNLNYRCLNCGPPSLSLADGPQNMVKVARVPFTDMWGCGKCNALYGTEIETVTHVNMEHHAGAEVVKDSAEEKKLSICEFCRKTFSTYEESLSHELTEHKALASRLEVYVCRFCPRWSWEIESIKKHASNKHGVASMNPIRFHTQPSTSILPWNKHKLCGWAMCGGCGQRQEGLTTVWRIPGEYATHGGTHYDEEKYACQDPKNQAYRCFDCGPPLGPGADQAAIKKALEPYANCSGACREPQVVKVNGEFWERLKTRNGTHRGAVGCNNKIREIDYFWGTVPEGEEPEMGNGNISKFRCLSCGPPKPNIDQETPAVAVGTGHNDFGHASDNPQQTAPVVQEEHVTVKMMKKKDADSYACIGRAWYSLRHFISNFVGDGTGPTHPWEIYTVKDAEVTHGSAYEYKASCKCCGVKIEGYFTNIAQALATDMTFTKTAMQEMGIKIPEKKMGLLSKLLFGWFVYPIRGTRKLVGGLARMPWEVILPVFAGISAIGGIGYFIDSSFDKQNAHLAREACASPKIVGTVKEIIPAGDFMFIKLGDKMHRVKSDKPFGVGEHGYICEREHFHSDQRLDQINQENASEEEKEGGATPHQKVPSVQEKDPATPRSGSKQPDEDEGADFH